MGWTSSRSWRNAERAFAECLAGFREDGDVGTGADGCREHHPRFRVLDTVEPVAVDGIGGHEGWALIERLAVTPTGSMTEGRAAQVFALCVMIQPMGADGGFGYKDVSDVEGPYCQTWPPSGWRENLTGEGAFFNAWVARWENALLSAEAKKVADALRLPRRAYALPKRGRIATDQTGFFGGRL